jgi:hypothetical protein
VPGSIFNTGTMGYAVLDAGGSFTNGATGTLYGVDLYAASTLQNAGLIQVVDASGTSNISNAQGGYIKVLIIASGSVTNSGSVGYFINAGGGSSSAGSINNPADVGLDILLPPCPCGRGLPRLACLMMRCRRLDGSQSSHCMGCRSR